MADSKISALTDGGPIQADDELAINRANTSYKARAAGSDGWINDSNETWTYVSGSGGGTASFKISGVDVTAKYPVGTRIKLTQTTVKYFVVTAVAFSTDTTVTITAGSDYTLANAAISANYHSFAASPAGYPGWFNFAPSLAGWSSTSGVTARFSVTGRVCIVCLNMSAGTSNATTATAVLPISSGASANASLQAFVGVDNGVTVTAPCRAIIGTSTTTWTFNSTWAGAGWTNSGTKRILDLVQIYEI